MHVQSAPFVADRKHCIFLLTGSLSTSTRNLFTLVERFCREPISGNTTFVPLPSGYFDWLSVYFLVSDWSKASGPRARLLRATVRGGRGAGRVQPWRKAARGRGARQALKACHCQRPREPLLRNDDDQRGSARQLVWH